MLISHRWLALAAFVVLASCTSSIRSGLTGETSASGRGSCEAGDYEAMVGQEFTLLNDASLPEDARVLFPGATVSDDSDPSRVNIVVGTDDKITRVYCG
jgi:hypothetical protein